MNATHTPTVTDDRGITHRAATFRENRCPDPDDPRVRAMFARLRSRTAEATKRTSTVTWGLLATIAVFVAGTCGSIIAANYASSRQLSAFLIGGIASAAGIGIGVLRHRAVRNAVGDVTGELLFIARCPACAYRLGTAPRVDGLVTCSECGAAWRADRVPTEDVRDAREKQDIRFRQYLSASFVRLPSVVDAHGRRQVVFGVVDPSCAADENIRRGLAALKARLQRRAWSILAFVGLAAVAVLYFLLRVSSSWWLTLMIVLVATLFVAAAIRWIIAGGRTRTRAGFVRLGLCPACANGVSDDGAGQLGCDACGACWQPPN